MPIYEYRCPACDKRSSIFYRTFAQVEEASPVCPHCGGSGLTRLVSRVVVQRSRGSPEERLSALDNLDAVDQGDPRSMARWLRQAGREAGEELGPEFDEAVEEMGDLGDMGDMDSLGGGDEDFC